MDIFQIYKDIKTRTGGEIYIGVVGPVRTGKSTFIKRFIETMVMPGLSDGHNKDIMRDELPQSAAGKTIMTTEPKFVPKDAAVIRLAEGLEAKVRLIDCVGFMVQGAGGYEENGEERLVRTPWFQENIPFSEAAELGTKKVIHDHSTIGVMVTTDGSIGDLSREAYLSAEEHAIQELKAFGKPFVILLNSVRPNADEVKMLAKKMEEQYGAAVLPMNCEQMKKNDAELLLETVLKEFPVTRIDFQIPRWMEMLDHTYPVKENMMQYAMNIMETAVLMRDVTDQMVCDLKPYEGIEVKNIKLNMDTGIVKIEMDIDEEPYYQFIRDQTGLSVHDEYDLIWFLKEMSEERNEYEKVKHALESVRAKGYGIVMPDKMEIKLDEPEMIRHGNKYGVKIHAQAPSINLIKANVETEIAPIVGSEQQAMDLISYINHNASDENGVWNTNIFGKSVEQIVEDGMQAKISQMTDECQMKLQDTLQKIINDSNGGMICIII